MTLEIKPSPQAPQYAFSQSDEIFIDGRQYQYFETRGNEHSFMPSDGNGVLQSFNNSQIARWLEKGKFEHKPVRAYEPLASISPQLLSLFSAAEKERAEFREAFVLAFLERYQAGKVKRTDHSITGDMGALRLRAGEIMETTTTSKLLGKREIPEKISARSVRRWLKAYEYHGLPGLYDRVCERGNYDRVLTDDERLLMYKTVLGYLSDLRKTPANIVTDVGCAFTAEK